MQSYIGDIRMFGGSFAIRNYAYCAGTLLSISQNAALASLLGTMYGGDGRSSFALPDLRGRVPVSTGQHPGSGINWVQGMKTGVESVVLTTNNLPNHSHGFNVSDNDPDSAYPVGRVVARGQHYAEKYSLSFAGTMASECIDTNGGGTPMAITSPTMPINFIIALQGVYPSRN